MAAAATDPLVPARATAAPAEAATRFVALGQSPALESASCAAAFEAAGLATALEARRLAVLASDLAARGCVVNRCRSRERE